MLNAHAVESTMTMHENMMSLSTASIHHDRSPGPRRYSSASHALGCYFLFIEKIMGAPGLDPERLGVQVQSSPSPTNPSMDLIDDVRNLASAFAYAERRAPEKVFGAWRDHRIKCKPLSKIRGVSKTTAHRYVYVVDSFIEAWLSERGLMCAVRVDHG